MMFVPSLLAFSLAALSGGPEEPFAFADYDGDGLLDGLRLDAGGQLCLLRNAGVTGFEDATAAAGLTGLGAARGALWHDVDGDGRVDLTLLTAAGGARLLYNSAEALFADGTDGSGLELATGVVSARWLDLDRDGRADLFADTQLGERLWRNVGDGSFLELPLPPLVGGTGGGSLALAGPGGFTVAAAPGPPVIPVCLPTMVDQASGGCLEASSFPEMGKLHPLSPDFMVSPNGNVGIGVGTPSKKLQVEGEVWATGDLTGRQLISNVSPGTPPLSVSSSTTVPNLSADRLDGFSSSFFTQLGQTIEGSEISNGTINGIDLAAETVRGVNVLDGSLTGADLAAATVDSVDLAPDAVDATHIAGASVGSSELAPNAVNSNHIQTGAVNSIDIQDGSISGGDIALFTIGDANISGSAGIQGTKVAPDFGAQTIVTTGNVGAGTSAPTADLHVLGDATRGLALIAPNQATGGGNADLFLAEDDDGSFGFRLRYEGVLNDLQVRGKGTGGDTVHMSIDRDSGRVGIGAPIAANARVNVDTTGEQYGLLATNVSSTGAGVRGVNTYFGVGGPIGVEGITSSPAGWGVFAEGNLGASGAKLFVQPHPLDPSKELHFACLEGNESGTYFRGSAQLVGGEAVIDVPADFRLVSEAEGLTVQVTPVGLPAALYVAARDLDRIVVRGNADVAFDYQVNGVRRGYADFETEAANRAFVPTERGVPFGGQYPAALRQLLVDNGTLNADFTPNEATAAALGWELRDAQPND